MNSWRFLLGLALGFLIQSECLRAAILAGPVTNAGNGHVYFLLASNTWTSSEVEARSLGGHLATVRNASEQSWIYSTFSHWGGANRNLWIGLYDPDPATNSADRVQRRTEFRWTSEEPTNTYANWSPVEPNNGTTETLYPELYVHIWNPTDGNASRWNNSTNYPIVLGVQCNGVVEIVPPVGPLGVARYSPASVDLYWKTETNKTYELLFNPDLLAPMPTNLVLAMGTSGTTSRVPATATLLYRAWTNMGGRITGTGATNHVIEPTDRPQRFYQLISFP
jgi:hypothetical protein